MTNRKKWIDYDTGEVMETVKGQNFVKMYKKNMIKMLEVVGGKKVKVIIYILNNIHLSNNTLIKTQREIAKDCDVSVKTVNETLKGLADKGILKKKAGAYMLSPETFYRGDERRKAVMMGQFNNFNSKKEE